MFWLFEIMALGEKISYPDITKLFYLKKLIKPKMILWSNHIRRNYIKIGTRRSIQ